MNNEEAIKRVNKIKENICYDSDEDFENQEALRDIEAIETVLEAFEEKDLEIETLETKIEQLKITYKSITQNKVIKDKIEDYSERKRYYDDNGYYKDIEYYKIEAKIEVLQDLLKGEKDE